MGGHHKQHITLHMQMGDSDLILSQCRGLEVMLTECVA